MIKIVGERGSGKTTNLLKLAQEKGYTVVEPTSRHVDFTRKLAIDLGFEHVPIISVYDWLHYHYYGNRHAILFDELEDCLMQLGVVGYSDTIRTGNMTPNGEGRA